MVYVTKEMLEDMPPQAAKKLFENDVAIAEEEEGKIIVVEIKKTGH